MISSPHESHEHKSYLCAVISNLRVSKALLAISTLSQVNVNKFNFLGIDGKKLYLLTETIFTEYSRTTTYFKFNNFI